MTAFFNSAALSRVILAGAAAVLAISVVGGGPAAALEKITFGTNWKAEAEHGGFYQALGAGIYEKYGLDVTIRPGGPQVNHAQLLAAGKIDFSMGSSDFEALNFVANNIPMVAVAAIFQKDPQVLIAHPGVGHDSLEALKGKPIMISNDARTQYWQWLKQAFGYTDDQIRPYSFNPAPFMADQQAVQQGYVTSEPFAIETQGGFKPVVHLLADNGFGTYSTTIQTAWKTAKQNPDLVQRFVDATIEGYVSYLYGDPSPGNALIRKHNPDMTDGQVAYTIATLKSYGIVDSGDTASLGIGAMTDKRWQEFRDFAVKAGLYKADIDLSKAYTLQFVNQGVGLELKKKLTGN